MMIRWSWSIALVGIIIGVADPTAAQESMVRNLRQALTSGNPCTGGPNVVLQQLEEYLRSLEVSSRSILQIYDEDAGGIAIRFSRQPNGNHPYTLHSDMSNLSVAIDKSNAFVNYPLPDSIPRILADAETLYLPDITSGRQGDSMMESLEKQVIAMMYAYNVTARAAYYCGFDVPGFGPSVPSQLSGTTLGAAAPVVAGGSAGSSGSGQGIAGGTRTLGRGSEQPLGQRFQPVVEGRRRSAGRTTGGVALLGTGVLFLLNGYLEAEDQRGVAERLRAGLPTLSASAERLRISGDRRGYQSVQNQYLETSGDAAEYEKSADQEFMMGLLIGVPLMTLGTLLATRWAHVGSDTVAFNVSPTGFRASKSFGW